MNTKSIIAFSAVAVAFALLVAPLAAASVDASHNNYNYNYQTSKDGSQTIKQSSSCTAQYCIGSGNNYAANIQWWGSR